MERPYIFINSAMTADGKMDDYERKGAAISSAWDKERVDELRASADAILVGGATLRDEDPKLTVKSEARRAERIRRGLSPNPIKVGVVSAADEVPLKGDFINAGEARKVIFAAARTSDLGIKALRALGVETYVHDSPRVNLPLAMQTLKNLGVKRLMVEGGATLNFELLRLGLADEILLYVAPMIFGGARAPTFADGTGLTRANAIHLKLTGLEVREDGGLLLRYVLQSAAEIGAAPRPERKP